MVVAGNAVSQGGKALVHALDHHFIGQAVPQVLDLWEHDRENMTGQVRSHH
jgi:hypothetical protein